jgi:hypothetical protein
MCYIVLLTLFCLVRPLTALPLEDPSLCGRDIMVMVDERPDGDDRKSVMTMILINKRNRIRERTVLSYVKDYGKDAKKLMFFQEPADVKGTAFLSWEYDDPARDDDKWLYMPALKRVRRISGKSRKEYFMGTDFTYDDMGDRNVDEDRHTLLREETLDGVSCWVVESVPLEEDPMYVRKLNWIRKDANVCIKREYYDKDGLIKILMVKSLERINGYWTILESRMENISGNHKTIMKAKEVQYDVGLHDELFRVSKLQRGNLR